jgi:ABC-2 type transport system ATP-binding protein
MIEVQSLTKRYGIHTALNGISFKAKKGEILGLLGPNGAGKTTTMRILTGYMPPTSGQASIAGFDVVENSLAVRQRVGYMPERIPLYPDMSVEGYLMFWARLRHTQKTRIRVDEVLERVQLTNRRKSLIRSLSKGMRQRLGLAQALVHEPEVVILDEPTIGIDPQQVIEVRNAVRELGEDHTVLFSTHILSEAEQVCDRVIILSQGQIVAHGTPENLRQQLFPRHRIIVQLGGATKNDAISILRKVPGVDHVEKHGSGYAIQASEGTDIRASVAQRVQQSGFKLLELRPVDVTLEDIFLNLVGKEK